MITVEEARQIIFQEVAPGAKQTFSLSESLGRVLAEELFSPVDSPPFDASAMDGFTLNHQESPGKFRVTELIAAGDVPGKSVGSGEAMQIMTGAMLPQGATAVIPQEEVLSAEKETIFISREIKAGENIRYKGEELKKGEAVLPKNAPLNAGAICFLASLGIFQVPVYSPPKIFILPTGSELVRDLKERGEGKIIESNSFGLQAALEELHIQAKVSHPVPDIPKILFTALETALNTDDLILITGGVSVGIFDLVKDILKDLKVETLFWKVAQKPGKPIFFGRRKNKFVFGLPGNPSSSLVCFYEYVRPVILKWLGYDKCFLPEEEGKLTGAFKKQDLRTHFIRAVAQRESGELWVTPLSGQESHKMQAFALANCLMVVPKEVTALSKGEGVEIHWLP